MSKVDATQGANRSQSTSTRSNAAQGKRKTKAPNSVVNNGKTAKKAAPKEPQRKEITVTLGNGTSLFELAMKYDTTVDAICKLNNIKNPDRVSVGQKIKIMAYDPKEKAEWDKYQSQLWQEEYEAKQAELKKQRKATAEAKIQEAKKNGRDDDYSYSVDKDGYVVITLKTSKKLHEIREEMGLRPGALDDLNNFDNRYGKIPVVNDGVRDVETWDNLKAKKGEAFRIDPFDMETTRTWTQFFKDLWPF